MFADCASVAIYTFLALKGWVRLRDLPFSPEHVIPLEVRLAIVWILSILSYLAWNPQELHTKSDILQLRHKHLRKNETILLAYLVFDAFSFIFHLIPFSFAIINAILMILTQTFITRHYSKDPNKHAHDMVPFFLFGCSIPAAAVAIFCNIVLSDLANGLGSAVTAFGFIVGLIIFLPLIMILLMFF